MIQSLLTIKWRVFIPVFLLFFSYVFGVAVDLLGEAQLFIRLFVILFVLSCVLLSKSTVSIGSLLIYLLSFIYLFLFFLISQNLITLNFIYLTILIYLLQVLKITKDELLFNSLVASLVVIFIYLVYFFIGDINLGEANIEGRVRYGFGFSNPNKIGIVAFSLIVLTALYSFKKNNSFIITVLLITPFLVVMMYSGSRTAIYSTVILFMLIVMPFTIKLRKILFFFPLIFLTLSMYIATLHNNELANFLLSLRPLDFYNFMSTLNSMDYLFGASTDGFRIDNSYILALVSIGPIGYVFVSYLLYRLGRSWPDVYELSFIIALLVYGVFEGVLVRVEFPIVLYFYYFIATHYKIPYLDAVKRINMKVSKSQSCPDN